VLEVGYYNQDRTHLSVCKDSPCGRLVEQRPDTISNVVGLPGSAACITATPGAKRRRPSRPRGSSGPSNCRERRRKVTVRLRADGAVHLRAWSRERGPVPVARRPPLWRSARHLVHEPCFGDPHHALGPSRVARVRLDNAYVPRDDPQFTFPARSSSCIHATTASPEKIRTLMIPGMHREKAIAALRRHLPAHRREFGARRIAPLGSTARGEAREDPSGGRSTS
jgi:hypothetical protein